MATIKIEDLCTALKGIGDSIGKIRDDMPRIKAAVGVASKTQATKDDLDRIQKRLTDIQSWTQEVEHIMRHSLEMEAPESVSAEVDALNKSLQGKCPIVIYNGVVC